MKGILIGSEVECDLARGSVNRGAVAGAERFLEISLGGIPGSHDVLQIEMDVIEIQRQEAPRGGHGGHTGFTLLRLSAARDCGRRGLARSPLHRKMRYGLGLPVVVKAKILLAQAALHAAFAVPHDHAHHHQVALDL